MAGPDSTPIAVVMIVLGGSGAIGGAVGSAGGLRGAEAEIAVLSGPTGARDAAGFDVIPLFPDPEEATGRPAARTFRGGNAPTSAGAA